MKKVIRVRLRKGFLVMVENSVLKVMKKRDTKLCLGFLPLVFVSSFMFFGYGLIATFLHVSKILNG